MSGVCVAGDSEGEHDLFGEGGGYVVARCDPLYDASRKVSCNDFDLKC